jgi:FtsP/CotA-like multicopper oxidase with cupredoxin domain
MMHRSTSPPSPRPLLAALLLAAGLGVAGACGTGSPAPAMEGAPGPMLAGAGPVIPDSILRDTLTHPPVISAVPVQVNGQTQRILDAEMHVVLRSLPLPGGGSDTMRTWHLTRANGQSYDRIGYPGPTFRVQPGDSVRILLVNDLPAQASDTACETYPASTRSPNPDVTPNCLHGPNSSNIHFHGFHVSPRDSADNVLLEVLPQGGRYQYAFSIPMNQAPGTHWYHPHKHGSVALQVTNGMSGAFIVEGSGLDAVSAGMRQHLVALQQIAPQLNMVQPKGDPPFAVNGQVSPVIVMRPGEVQRWRLVNENVAKASNGLIFFTPGGPKMYDAARDGIQYAPSNYSITTPDDSLLMAPGNRLDVLVKAPGTPGLHELRVSPVAEDESNGLSNRERLRVQRVQSEGVLLDANFSAAEQPQTLLRVYVTGPTSETYATVLPPRLPALPSFLDNLADPGGTQASLVFSEVGGPGGYPNFYLGTAANPRQQFNPNQDFLTMPLGGTQNWKIENRTVNGLPHPFHIHINPFQVTEVVYPLGKGDPNHLLYEQLNLAAATAPIWLDVIPLPLPVINSATGAVTSPAYIHIRQRYDNFTGPYVIHCHILGHEERGMMQRIAVTPDGGPETGTAGAHAGHGNH